MPAWSCDGPRKPVGGHETEPRLPLCPVSDRIYCISRIGYGIYIEVFVSPTWSIAYIEVYVSSI